MARPALFVTGHAPPERVAPFARLAQREHVVFALFGGRALHALGEQPAASLGFPHLRVSQRHVGALAASGRFRAVLCGTGGRVALPAAFVGARHARVPFLLWASIWGHPRSLAGALGYAPLRAIYRRADAVVTYGPHVSRYVRAKGARRVLEAPQAVDNAFWSQRAEPDRRARFQVVFIGRPERQKGLAVLLDAWWRSRLAADGAVLVLVGPELEPAARGMPGVQLTGRLDPAALRNLYGGSDVLVVPSVPTATVRETWALVVNEAMNQGLCVIASEAVGAAAGGLVRDGVTGRVVPAQDPGALAAALRRAHDDPGERERLASAGYQAVSAYTFDAWVGAFARALALVETSGVAC